MIKSVISSLLLLLLLSSCDFWSRERIKGNGNIVTENRQASSFTGIEVSGAIDVYIRQDSSFAVKVETDENLQPYLITEVDGSTLRIKSQRHVNIRPTRLKVYVTAPSFKELEASGACKIYSENRISSPGTLDIDLSGASDATLDIHAPKVEAGLSGAGKLELKGETKELRIEGSGSSDIHCFELMAEEVSIDISGAGNAEVFASVKLDVDVSGAGDIKYKGNPAIEKSISGAGSVKKVD